MCSSNISNNAQNSRQVKCLKRSKLPNNLQSFLIDAFILATDKRFKYKISESDGRVQREQKCCFRLESFVHANQSII